MFITLQTLEEVKTYIKETPGYVFIYKHSATCPVAILWKREVEMILEKLPDTPIIYVHVWDNRELSDHIAEHFATKHESPQLLTFKNGKLKDVKNHHSVTTAYMMHTLNWWYNG